MTHLIALDHSFEHNSEHKEEITSSAEFLQITNQTQDCSLCDIYLDVELSKDPTFTHTLLTLKLITEKIIKKDNNFTSVIFHLKKSRAPPYFSA